MMNVPFRLYDKGARRMLYAEEATGNGVFISLHGEPVQYQDGMMMRLLNVVLMRRTPHTDYKSDFIWEGDICEFDLLNELGSAERMRGFMRWDTTQQKWNFKVVTKARSPLLQAGQQPVYNTRVLGDLYTTPHLLKEEPMLLLTSPKTP